ncbi:MAG: hypothetical protein EBR10_11195, partial [Planctomycetes bacterium]|nr:hypothetical protein [Planctomycetota bacterium]
MTESVAPSASTPTPPESPRPPDDPKARQRELRLLTERGEELVAATRLYVRLAIAREALAALLAAVAALALFVG